MAEKNKSGFHTVGDTDMEEYNRKIKEHRRKVLAPHRDCDGGFSSGADRAGTLHGAPAL